MFLHRLLLIDHIIVMLIKLIHHVCMNPCLCTQMRCCLYEHKHPSLTSLTSEVAVMNGCSGCYCGNCSERANSCNVTTGGVSFYSKILLCSHHHYHTGKLTVPSSSRKFKGIGICYVSAPQSIGSTAECVNFQRDANHSLSYLF